MTYDVLVVDDEKDIRDLVSGILEDEGYQARSASDGVSALQEIRNRQPNLVILDVWLGNSERDGLKILETIRRDHPYVPVVMISGHATVEIAVSAIRNGAYDFIEKPFQSQRLLTIVERAIESAHLKRENEELRNKSGVGGALLGNSSTIIHIRNLIEEAALCQSRVLIEGSAGVGKQTIARQIHRQSARAQQPFLVINSQAIHPSQIEAELFGTEIIGMDQDAPRKIGALERAHGGILYLAGLDEMPLNVQIKLNRLLQDNVFYRVGGDQPVRTNVRIMAGCITSAETAINEQRLLPELFYRLNVINFKIPCLRERPADIPVLLHYFLKQIAQSRGVVVRKLAEETMALLQTYEWPGNLHQLRNTVEWLYISTPSDFRDPIPAHLLPPDVLGGMPMASNWQQKSCEIVVMPLRQARETFEKEYIVAQIKRFGGNISETARFIGMERSALYRKLKSLGILSAREA